MPKGFIRLDKMVSQAFGVTRSVARDQITKGMVRLNGLTLTKTSRLVPVGEENMLQIFDRTSGPKFSVDVSLITIHCEKELKKIVRGPFTNISS